MQRRVWSEPDGTIKITTFIEDSLVDRDCQILQSNGSVHPDATFVHFPDEASFNAAVPKDPDADRVRDKWRLRDGKIVVDRTVPDPPHPKASLLAQVAAAKSLPDLQAVLTAILSQP